MNEATLTGTVWFTFIYAGVVLVYSIYQLYLNKKQADVKKEIELTNKILFLIYEQVAPVSLRKKLNEVREK